MMTVRLKHVLATVLAATGFYGALLYVPHVPPVLLNSFGFAYIMLVPGGLLYLLLLYAAPKKPPAWMSFAIIVCLSLLSLLITGLVTNTVLPLIGVDNPLGETPVRVSMLASVAAWSSLVFWKYRRHPQLALTLRRPGLNQRELYVLLAPLVLVGLSVLGAVSLNNGASSFFTQAMMCMAAVYVLTLIIFTSRTRNLLLAYGMSATALALLLSTSLRGWYTTGHDIQHEFLVFELTKHAGQWSATAYQDAYNACLSITIFPAYLSHLLAVDDVYIYKVFFQILFAITAGVVFHINARYLRRQIAVVATVWYISFPTFFNDMPMLNRQELAFLFFAVMIWVLFDKNFRPRIKRFLLYALAIGIILSHYSTTYSIIVIFGSAVVFRWLLKLALRLRYHLRKQTPGASQLPGNFQVAPPSHRPAERYLTWSFVVFITLASFCWTVLITNTGSGVSRTVTKTYQALVSGTKGDSQSLDVSYGLFRRAPQVDEQQRLKQYVSNGIDSIQGYNQNDYYGRSATGPYAMKVIKQGKLPLTALGNLVNNTLHIPIKRFNASLRQLVVRLLQVSIFIGLAYVLVKLIFLREQLDMEFYSLSVAMMFFVTLQILLPVLSTQYGLLRAFQQALIVVSTYIVIGIVALLSKLRYTVKLSLVVAFALICMISTSGTLTGIFGGYTAQLNLSNSGDYYDNYYVHEPEVAAARWLSVNAKGSAVQMEGDTFQKLNNIVPITRGGDILPQLMPRNSYVLLGARNVIQGQAQFIFNGDSMTYSYPIKFLDDQKDLLYANDTARIYR